MFSHVMMGNNEIEKATRFYDEGFDAIGVEETGIDAKGRYRKGQCVPFF